MLTYAHVCSRMLTYASYVSSSMYSSTLTTTRRMLTYADVCLIRQHQYAQQHDADVTFQLTCGGISQAAVEAKAAAEAKAKAEAEAKAAAEKAAAEKAAADAKVVILTRAYFFVLFRVWDPTLQIVRAHVCVRACGKGTLSFRGMEGI